MTGFFLTVHVLVAAALIGVILLQRSDGGALGGIGGGSDPFGGVMSQRGSANLLTRTTSILAVVFMALSLLLAILESRRGVDDLPLLPPPGQGVGRGILEPAPPTGEAAPAVVPAAPAGGAAEPVSEAVPDEGPGAPAGSEEPAPPTGE